MKSDRHGRTPVHFAAMFGSLECLKVFKKHEVDLLVVDNDSAMVQHLAAAGGHLECLKYLMKLGIPLTKKDKAGRISSHYVKDDFYC